MKKCLVIGAAMLDIIMKIERLPKSGEDVYADSQEMMVGGCAYNVADIMKHFGASYTLFAPVGDGIYGKIISRKLREAGHEIAICSQEKDNGYCLCLVEREGERTFLTLPGVECNFQREWFHELHVEEYDSAYVSGYEIEGEGGDAILEFFEKNPSLTVYYAPGPRIMHLSKEKQARMKALHPVVHLNEKEALEYTGEPDFECAAQKLYEDTGNTVIITLGARGAYLKNEDDILVSAKEVKATDTTGAGDAHIGTVIAMRQRGREYREAVKAANRVSAMVVGVEGPTLTKEEFQKEREKNE
ncbi:MAG: PfkB family carbohydrate kinase [Eubacteriales bacterium]|nr:PfkB family carbohydrate kinase [Eubacteriales bacterium]